VESLFLYCFDITTLVPSPAFHPLYPSTKAFSNFLKAHSFSTKTTNGFANEMKKSSTVDMRHDEICQKVSPTGGTGRP